MSDDAKMVTIQVRVTPDLLDRIEHYRLHHSLRPTRSQYMRHLLETAVHILDDHTAGRGRSAKKTRP